MGPILFGESFSKQGIGLFSSYYTFTGDGSTTTFDLTNAAHKVVTMTFKVFVDNVRQQVVHQLNN